MSTASPASTRHERAEGGLVPHGTSGPCPGPSFPLTDPDKDATCIGAGLLNAPSRQGELYRPFRAGKQDGLAIRAAPAATPPAGFPTPKWPDDRHEGPF